MPSQAQAEDAVQNARRFSVGATGVDQSPAPETSRRARCRSDGGIETLFAQGIASDDEGASMPLQLDVRVRSPDQG